LMHDVFLCLGGKQSAHCLIHWAALVVLSCMYLSVRGPTTHQGMLEMLGKTQSLTFEIGIIPKLKQVDRCVQTQ